MTAHNGIFISYAHRDNGALSEDQQGWITRFHRMLKSLLEKRMAGELNIWRDEKLDGNDIFADEIDEQLRKVRLLITIMSPNYVESEWCRRELNTFIEAADANGGLTVENKSRVIKVVKIPVEDYSSLPHIVQEQLGFDFYIKRGEAPLELDPAYGKDLEPLLNEKMAILAWEIACLLKTMATSSSSASGPAPDGSKPTVYLAETSFQYSHERDALAITLRQSGYEVLPQQRLPLEQEAYAAEVRKLLDRSDLAVHLIGSRYVPVLDGPDMLSIAALQNELAALQSKERNLPRLVWAPADLEVQDERQKEFVRSMHEDEATQLGADVVTGPLQDLEEALLAELKTIQARRQRAERSKTQESQEGKLVYLLCDRKDRDELRDARKQLKAAGIRVRLPLADGTAAEVREENDYLLATCDAAVIYYGSGKEAWYRSVERDLRKMAAPREGKPKALVRTLLAAPDNPSKQDLIDFPEQPTIDGRSSMANAITQLVAELQA